MKINQKISDIMSSVDSEYTINRCHNGFVIEVRGHDKDEEWMTLKYVVQSVEDLLKAVTELAQAKNS